MTETLDDLYLTWLYSQVGSVKSKNKAKTYWSLTRQLYNKEFVWFVPNDDNRMEDGRQLRHEWIRECDVEVLDLEWMALGCSMLEMFIALARRLNFQDFGNVDWCFWHMIENLDLKKFNDREYNQKSQIEIDEVLDRVIWRNYDENGRGGIFPLQHSDRDQRQVEIWYQFCAYGIERDYI